MIGTFSSLDLVLFYLFFEGGLIPMFLIIGIWGRGRAGSIASFKFFLYTLLGSVPDAARHHGDVLAGRHDRYPDADEGELSARDADVVVARVLRLVRREDGRCGRCTPGCPTRTFEAPDRGLGHSRRDPAENGRLRLPALLAADVPARLDGPCAADLHAPRWWRSSIPSLVALVQEDMKKLIAYSSVAHMGFVTMGIFALTTQGRGWRHLPDDLARAGLGRAVPVRRASSTTACTRARFPPYGGLVNNMPVYALVFMLFTMAKRGTARHFGLRR